jgi:kynurenine formamidase
VAAAHVALSTSSQGEARHDVIAKAKVYDLGQPYFIGMPVHPADPPFLLYLYRYHEQTWKQFKDVAPGFADSLELITTSMHSGTHLDALCHMSRNGKLYGGVTAADLETHTGYTKMSIEEAPIFVKRAVLLDVAAYKGVDVLPARYEITPGDLEATAKREQVQIRVGDALLVRTGWSRFFTTDPHAYLHDFAGVTAEGARWIAQQKIALTGIDNLAYGVPKPFEQHLIFIADNGIFMMKSLNLEELARDRVYASTLIVSPLKIRGATGSLVRPVALA